MNDTLHLITFPSRVLIVGLGETGVAAARWCVRQGANVRVADTREVPSGLEALRQDLDPTLLEFHPNSD